MTPPIFKVCAASAGVTALLGSGPVRLYMFGEAPQGVALPYAVWQLVGGEPENYLGQRPDMDAYTVQVDVYAGTGSSAREVAEALRDALEGHCHITRWGAEQRSPDTQHYRKSFDLDYWVSR